MFVEILKPRKVLELFKNALTEETREDAKKIALAMTLQFLKKQKDDEMSNDISNFIANYYKEDSQFIEFSKWLKLSLKI